MIPRTLVPWKVTPVTPDSSAAPGRLSTSLDSRSLVPPDLPVVMLDGQSAIPAHVPLEVLGQRTLVPRDTPATPLETGSAPRRLPLTLLDSRLVVPGEARPIVLDLARSTPRQKLPEVLEPDIWTTGEVNLLVRSLEAETARWNWQAITSTILHFVLIAGLVQLKPKLFPYRPPTQEELELARRHLGFIYLPPPVVEVPQVPSAPQPSSPQIRIDPRVLRQVARPEAEPSPLPGAPEPPRVQRDLPNAPAPQAPGSGGDAARDTPRFETPKQAEAPAQLTLPQSSPGRLLEDSIRGSARGRGGAGADFGGPAPAAPGGGGQAYLGGNIEMLTPTEGVDFTNYLARVLASVKRNWYAVIPESARLGEKGKVVIQFRILRDGNVPYPEPNLVRTSGREPLDRAALSAIRASSPFEPLPPAFSGPFIELRFIFLYNLPLDYQ